MEKQIRAIIHAIRQFTRKKLHFDQEDFPYYVSIFIALLLFFFGLDAFVDLTNDLSSGTVADFDDMLTVYIQSFRSPGLSNFLIFITYLGDRLAYIIMIILLSAYFFIRFRNWKYSAQVVGVLILSSALNLALKQLIQRQRPPGEHLVEVLTLSYPSGHSMSAMAFYGFLIYLVWRHAASRWARVVITFLCASLILLIGISRVYLGVHYPSDVVAGFTAGLIWVAFCIIIFNLLSLLRKKKAGYIQEE